MMSDSAGASSKERLLAAARADNEEMMLEVLEDPDLDINCTDGMGNTALHISVMNESTDVIDHILSHDNCDVDPINRTAKATPLHLAVQLENPEARKFMVQTLLDAGADTTIKDKNNETVVDLLSPEDVEIRTMIRKSKAQASVSMSDIANDDDDDDDAEGSGSDSD